MCIYFKTLLYEIESSLVKGVIFWLQANEKGNNSVMNMSSQEYNFVHLFENKLTEYSCWLLSMSRGDV